MIFKQPQSISAPNHSPIFNNQGSTQAEIIRSTPLPILAESVHALAVGDLTGDGKLDTVLRHVDGGTVHLIAIAHDGTTMWRFSTGLPAKGGWDKSSNHVPFLCWDFNGEGYASVAVHSAGLAWPKAAINRIPLASQVEKNWSSLMENEEQSVPVANGRPGNHG